MKVVGLFCLLIGVVASLEVQFKLLDSAGRDLCDLVSQDIDMHRAVILKWCMEDSYCAEIFHQSEGKNVTVFTYLSEYIIKKYRGDLNGPLIEMLCQEKLTLEYLQERTWVNTLLAKRSVGHPLPMPNHKIVFNKDKLKMSFECLEDENCDDFSKDMTYLDVAFSLMLLALVIMACSGLFMMKSSYVGMNRLSTEIENATPSLKATIIKLGDASLNFLFSEK